MTMCTRRLFAAVLGFVWLSQTAWGADPTPQKQAALTFFGWSDQHVQADGNGEHLIPAIDAMNALPGRPYPEAIGGVVEKPAFVFGAGDISEWPSRAAMDTYEQFVTKRLKFPTYDIAGNHDLGGHYHKATVHNFRGVNFVQLPSPGPKSANESTVLRVTSDRLVAIPFNYKENRWASEKQKILDLQIKGPAKTQVQEQTTESPK